MAALLDQIRLPAGRTAIWQRAGNGSTQAAARNRHGRPSRKPASPPSRLARYDSRQLRRCVNSAVGASWSHRSRRTHQRGCAPTAVSSPAPARPSPSPSPALTDRLTILGALALFNSAINGSRGQKSKVARWLMQPAEIFPPIFPEFHTVFGSEHSETAGVLAREFPIVVCGVFLA